MTKQSQLNLNEFFSQGVNEIVPLTLNSDKSVVIHQGGTSCFDGNTLVVTKEGTKKISDIKIGDVVKSLSMWDGKPEWKAVKDVFRYENQKNTVKVLLKNGESIVCTDDHKFWFPKNGKAHEAWMPIIDILKIDKAEYLEKFTEVNNFGRLMVSDIESFEYVSDIETVYDISVTDNTNYFIHAGKDILAKNSGKTFGLIQCCIIKAISEPRSRILVVGKDVPSLKQGAMTDMQSILINDPHIEQYIKQFHSTDKTYFFHNGSRIVFRSFETIDQAKHGKREYAFFNEANGIPYDIYFEVSTRTTKQVWIDFNPNAEFWAHTKVWKPEMLDANNNIVRDDNGEPVHAIDPNVILYKTTWRNNEAFLPKAQIAKIERMKETDPMKYRIYGLGEVGVIDGLVFNNIKIVKDWPEVFWTDPHKYFVNQGLDFGFSKDPAAMVRTGVLQEEGRRYLYLDELFYGKSIMLDDFTERGILKRGLKRLVRENTQKGTYAFADSSRPETIAELVAAGCSVRKANKKPGSIISGLEMMLSYDEIRVTERSVNLRKEFNNYSYGKDRDGENNVMPNDNFNHCFVGETMITTLKGDVRIDEIKEGDLVLTRIGYKPVLKTFDNGLKEIYQFQIYCNNKIYYKLQCTPNHKICTSGGWIEISYLKSGMEIFIQDEVLKVEKITRYSAPETEFVYDLMVADCHEYYANGVLVHNCIDAARYAELMRKFIKAQGFFTIDPWGISDPNIVMEFFD